jgi:hypothetical protein
MECECKPGFVFKTKTTFATHQKSDTHKLHVFKIYLDTANKRIKQLEADIIQKNLVERTLVNTISNYEIWAKTLSPSENVA